LRRVLVTILPGNRAALNLMRKLAPTRASAPDGTYEALMVGWAGKS
jgi:hypothetical protein